MRFIRLLALACTFALAACAALPDRARAPNMKPMQDYSTGHLYAGAERASPDVRS